MRALAWIGRIATYVSILLVIRVLLLIIDAWRS